MTRQADIFEYYQNTLCVVQDVFMELGLLTYNQLQNYCRRDRRKMTRLRTAGRGRTGLIKWASIEDLDKKAIMKVYGDPYQKENAERMEERLENDSEAAIFAAKVGVSPHREREIYTEAQILNAYSQLVQLWEEKSVRNPNFRVTEARQVAAAAIQELKIKKLPNGEQAYPHRLPANPVSLYRRWEQYKEEGYESLLHGNRDKRNAAKIKGNIKHWLISAYGRPNKPKVFETWQFYDSIRKEKKWPVLTEDAIYKFLMKPENKKKWFLGRHGEAKWRDKYGHKVVRDRTDWFPNMYMSIDGSKLDWIHFKKGAHYNMGADLWFDCVFDVYSEKILGYYVGLDHENFTQHFSALKMALSESLEKPHFLTYDNQGGHKKAEMQQLYNGLISSKGKHYPHAPNRHGSPVEQLFSRLQQQCLNTAWYSDKQAVTAIREDSRPNMEFIIRHRDKLPTIEECIRRVDYYVKQWNEMEHPKFKKQSRNEVYNHSAKFKLDQLNELEVLDLFWIYSKNPVTYKNTGFNFTVRHEDYHFEVYDADGNVDLDFRDKYTGCRFYYRFDPNHLDTYVRLYLALPNGEKKYVANAEPIKPIKSVDKNMQKADYTHRSAMLKVRDEELERTRKALALSRNRSGLTEEELIRSQELAFKQGTALNKAARTDAEKAMGYAAKY